MTVQLRVACIVGAILTIAGSWSPWWCEGDLIWYCTKGIHIWFPACRFVDNGGLLIVFLSAATIGLVFRPPRFARKPAIWAVGCTATLTLASIYQVGRWLVKRAAAGGAIGASELGYGLVMVLLGSLVLLATTLQPATWQYNRKGVDC